MAGLLDNLETYMRPLKTRVMNMIGRALVKLVDDSTARQECQLEIEDGEEHDGVERFQNYGFTSKPFTDSEAIVLFVSGNRDHPVIVALDDARYRITDLVEGEVAMYTDEDDPLIPADAARHFIKLARGRIVIVAGAEVKLGGPDATVAVALKSDLDALKAIFDAWVVVPMDGGAALKTGLGGWSPVGATKVKAK